MIESLGRMKWQLLIAAVTLAILAAIHSQQLGVLLLKVNLLAVCAWLGYFIDREVFPYARPGDLITAGKDADEAARTRLQSGFNAASLRRAIIIAATMLAGALAL